jgi:hypothetical protein
MPVGGDTVVTHWTVADALVTRRTWHTPPSWPTRLPPLEQVVGEDFLVPWAEPVLAEVEIEVLCALPAAGLLAPGDLQPLSEDPANATVMLSITSASASAAAAARPSFLRCLPSCAA